MEIISISVTPQTKKRMDEAMLETGCKSRSKLVAMAVDSLSRELSPLEQLSGKHTAVITLVFGDKEMQVNKITHEYPGMVKLNAHLDSKTGKGCAEILVVEGSAEKIREIYKSFKTSKEVKSANFALA